MKRLRDEVDSSDPRMAAAGRLVAQVAPLTASDARTRRVRRAIDRNGSSGARPRAGAVLIALLGLAGSAAGAWGVATWVASDVAPQESTSDVEAALPTNVAPLPVRPPLPPAGREDPASEPQSPRTPAQAQEEAVPAVPSSAGSVSDPSSRQVRSSNPPKQDTKAPPSPTLSEARLVQEAVEALRSGKDADRAGELLDEYRRNSSSGHLDEEALALAIEVALAKKSPDAARHARVYLQKYPGGKFTPLAQRALRTP